MGLLNFFKKKQQFTEEEISRLAQKNGFIIYGEDDDNFYLKK